MRPRAEKEETETLPVIPCYHRFVNLTTRFTFDAAHRILGHPGKCAYLHGHTYHLEVTVASARLDAPGVGGPRDAPCPGGPARRRHHRRPDRGPGEGRPLQAKPDR